MSGGGKGGTSTSTVEIPQYLENASRDAIAQAQATSQLGYMPYMGPDVAAFTPQQEASFAGANLAAGAFGLPQGDFSQGNVQNFGGVRGLSSYPIFSQAQNAWASANPGQADYYNSFFINPQTGAGAAPVQQSQPAQPQGQFFGLDASGNPIYIQTQPDNNEAADYQTSWIDDMGGSTTNSGSGAGIFTDFFDGGGLGASGDSFQGLGLISTGANLVADPIDSTNSGFGGGK